METFYIGKGNITDPFFNGSLYDFKHYNTLLNDDNIYKLYIIDSSVMRYIFDPLTINSISVGNIMSNSLSYDASITNDNLISIVDNVFNKYTLNLNGNSSNFMTINNNYISGTNGITICMWFKSNNNQNNTKLLDFGNGAENDNIFIGIHNNNLSFGLYNGNTLIGKNNNVYSNINDGNWRHLVWSIDVNGNWNIYMNGILSRIFNNGIPILMDNNSNELFNVGGYPNSIFRNYLYLGKSNWNNDNYFNGSYYDVRIYNMTLNNNYINKMYNGLF
jgi:hypothetical protein